MKIVQLLSILCSILFVSSSYSFAQNTTRIDSLTNALSHKKGEERIAYLSQLSQEYINISESRTFSYAYQALELANKSNKTELLSACYFDLGNIHYRITNYDSSLYYYNKSLKTSTTNEHTALILDNIGVLYKDRSKYDSALVFLNQSLKLKETLADRNGVSASYTNIGSVYFQMKKFEDALDYYTQAYQIKKTLGDKAAIAAVLNNIGDTHKNLFQYEQALTAFNKSLQIQKSIGNKVAMAHTLNYIGNFYFQLKIYDKAQEFYMKSLNLRNQIGNKNDIAASTFNIATVHRDLGNYREALKYYDQALTLRQQTGAKEAEALILTALGGLYKNKKFYKLAIYNYELALDMYKKMGNKQYIANSYERLGIAYKDTSLYVQAEEYYLLASHYFAEVQNSIGVARIYNYLGNLYKEKDDYKQSLVFYNQSFAMYDSLKNTNGMAYVAFNIGMLHEKYNAWKKALQAYDTALEYAHVAKDYELKQNVAHSLYNLHKINKDFNAALHYYEKYAAQKDTLIHHRNLQRISEIEFESNMKLLEQINENQELKLHEEQIKRYQSRLYLFIVAAILIIITIFSLLLFRQYAHKEKAYNLLTEKSTELTIAYNNLEDLNTVLYQRNETINDSLRYAKRIQKVILPTHELIQQTFERSFVYYVPKEIVSGDFYWHAAHNDYVFFAVIDCTGHGVPGAFMSMVSNTLLNQIVNEQHIFEPKDILQQLDSQIIKTLRQYDESNKQEDGLEISLLRIHKQSGMAIFAGAGHKLYVVRQGELSIIPSSIYPIGGMHLIKQDNNVSYTQTEIAIHKGTSIYMFSDGYIDQFGGEKDERFSSGRFSKLITDIQRYDIDEQYAQLSKTFDNWRGNQSQLDDVLVVGIQF